MPVTLFDVGGNQVGTTTTDANGIYGFSSLPPGDYYLRFGRRMATSSPPKDQGGDPGKDSDADALGLDRPSSPWRRARTTRPATPACPASPPWVTSSGKILNGNGIQDAGEPGVADVSVNLYDGDGHFIDPTTTDANGDYLFNA